MKKKNTLLLVGMVLTLLLLTFPIPTAAAGQYIWTSTYCGQVGAQIEVYGYDFTPESNITITWDGDPIATDPETVVTDESGYFSADIVVPEVSDGNYTIRATDGEGLWAEDSFNVGSLYISTWPDCGQAGARVNVDGYGFTPNKQITITWDGDPIATDPAMVVTDESGRFSADIVVPEVSDGDYTIRATDGESLYAEDIFEVGSLYISTWPDCGQAGARVSVDGCGFTPNKQITITWDGDPIATDPAMVVTSENGCFYADIIVPEVSDGDYTIEATDGEGLYAQGIFEVGYLYIDTWPDYGQVGARVYVDGCGFTPESNITITWDGDPIATDPETVVTSESGCFYVDIIVPETSEGEHTIRATDGESLYAEYYFNVGPPSMWVYPWQVWAGGRVEVYGYSFTPSSNITVTWEGDPIATDPEIVQTDDSGYFYAYIVVPDVEYGDYTIRATDGEGLYAEESVYVSPPEIWFDPWEGPAGGRIEIYGEGFTPESNIAIAWEGEPITTNPGTVETDDEGYFSAYIVVPDVEYGYYTVRATDGESLWAEQTFEVAPPWIGCSPSQGPVGGWVEIYGYSFTPGSDITVTWEGDPVTTDPETAETNDGGYFSAYIVVPDVEYGYYTVRATDGESLWAERTFEVAPPEISFSSSEGPVGALVEIYGYCFSPGSNIISVTWEGVPLTMDPELVEVNERGRFYDAYIVVPDADYGDYTIRVTDGEGLWAERTFEVAPPRISFYPSEGPVGGRIRVSGECFTPGGNITSIAWEGVPLTMDPELVEVDDRGYFYGAYIIVPDADYGDYTIRVTDGEGLWAEETFSVIPPYIQFWPWTRGPAGSSFEIGGRAFTPESEISITWNGGPIDTNPEVVVTNYYGRFGAEITVPDVPDGEYTVRATDGEGLWAEEVFTVGPIPTAIWLFPWQGTADSYMTIIGIGFTPESEITIACDGDPISLEEAWFDVDPWGILLVDMITLPDVSLGYHTIEVTDEEDLSGQALFNIVNRGVSVFPGGGSPGDWAFLMGSGFTANNEVVVTLDSEPIEAYGETDSRGQLWGEIEVPDVPAGDYTMRATDEEELWAETAFRVSLNGIAVSPSEGLAGSLVFAYVWDISYESDITITWDGELVETSTFLSEFLGLPVPSYAFIVPDVQAGDYTVRAMDGEELWGETTFTVIEITTSPPPTSRCFIATAAYGTPMADEVQILRDFRDGYLLTNPMGQAFVGLYYKLSPPIAELITDHPSLKPVVRVGLLPAVAMSTVIVNATATEKVVILSVLVLVSVVVALWVTRRRGRGLEYN